MFKRDDNSKENNFWISYADLMAGLLFVFILLIGAIVTKSIILRENLNQQIESLKKTQKVLKAKEESLNKTKLTLQKAKDKIKLQNKTIKEQEKIIKLQKDEVLKLKVLLKDLQLKLNRSLKKEENLSKALVITKDKLKLKEKELERLNQLLLAKNSKIDALNGKIIILQNLLKETNTTLSQKDKIIQEYKNRVLILSKNLTKKEDELKLKDEKLLKILNELDKQKSKYEDLVAKLREKRAKIKALTGIRLKVIEALKDALGDKIEITKDGALKIKSNVLFDKGSFELKEEAKSSLKEIFEKYISALMSNQAIKPYIDKIVIEGHTDSDGGYLYNLRLSQNRALSVMNYLLTLPIAKKYNLQPLLEASGRAYMDRIMVNGVEDKNASRRIEIKFRLKNQYQMYEIERILDEK